MSNAGLNELTAKYPGVEFAYQFAIDSYEIAWKRWDAMESRIHGLMALAAALTLAIPTAGKSLGLELNSVWFYLALAAFIGLMGVGFYARSIGSLKVVDPTVHYDKWLHYTEWEFKKNFIYWSGIHYDLNRQTIHRKWRLMVIVMALFTFEVVCISLLALYRP